MLRKMFITFQLTMKKDAVRRNTSRTQIPRPPTAQACEK